ncbi:hypothetical protein CH341_04460 [Rhodoplanes roseus]|uniref:AAA+ ATPase domain-containing protein n=2 Tax=Rhodoplanes roseus TaxID=29409 RepID=A0A327L743_9BRAD|nr:hypothetical protein CH341_04460 [Rhodoplanes roseus]
MSLTPVTPVTPVTSITSVTSVIPDLNHMSCETNSTSPGVALAKKYAPRTFEEVRGQREAVRLLRQLALRGKRARNLLFAGAFGSGKSTLARLTHMSLNCRHLTPEGSPCGVCDCCRDPRTFGYFEYDVPLRGGSSEEVGPWVQAVNSAPADHHARTLFFDEAHALEASAVDVLLTAIDRGSDRVSFCFATTEPDALKLPLHSRLIRLDVNALALAEAVQFMEEIAQREGIPYSIAALKTLCTIKQGHPRDLLIGLEHVASLGPVTIENVKSAFGLEPLSCLVEYFFALADADVRGQLLALERWQDDMKAKVQSIYSYLASLYYRDLRGRDVIIDPVVDSFEDGRATVIEKFRLRLGLEGRRELIPYWDKLISHWAGRELRTDPERWLSLASFGELAGNGLKHCRTQDEHRSAIITDGSVPSRVVRPCGASEIVNGEGSRTPNGINFLEPADVRKVMNLASFLIQHYDVLINAGLTVRPGPAAKSDSDGMGALKAFCWDLGQRAPRAHEVVDVIAVFDRDEDGLLAHVAVRVPAIPDWAGELNQWCNDWQHERFGPVTFDLSSSGADPVRFHWDQIRNLCAGLAIHDLLDKLGVPRRGRRPSGPVPTAPTWFSERLSDDAVAQACQLEMAPLSAFDDEAWDWIGKGWETKEHVDRVKTIAKRQQDVEELRRIWHADLCEQDRRLNALVAEWRVAPQNRRRRWHGWWVNR